MRSEQRQVAERWNVDVFVATAGGVGLVPLAPGTWGALVGVGLTVVLQQTPSAWVQGAILVGLFLWGVGVCRRAVERLGRGKDPGAIVWDEVVSMPVVFLGLGSSNWSMLVAGYLLHRLFDIAKPPPIRQLERLPHGWGIMADDVVAALYAQLALRGLLWAGVILV